MLLAVVMPVFKQVAVGMQHRFRLAAVFPDLTGCVRNFFPSSIIRLSAISKSIRLWSWMSRFINPGTRASPPVNL